MVSVVQRKWAAKYSRVIPGRPARRAVPGTPITVDDVLNSRMIAYPFRLLQCCLVTDGGGLSPSRRPCPRDYLYLVDDMTRTPVPSTVYKLFEEAIIHRKQILCTYHGRLRELCPIILGRSQGREKALTYQFGGQSNKGLPPGGQWRCLWFSEVSNVRLRDGPWHAGDSHNQPQGCVDVVDLDVNPASPYNPKRRL